MAEKLNFNFMPQAEYAPKQYLFVLYIYASRFEKDGTVLLTRTHLLRLYICRHRSLYTRYSA